LCRLCTIKLNGLFRRLKKKNEGIGKGGGQQAAGGSFFEHDLSFSPMSSAG
jgi:hypothetical protein